MSAPSRDKARLAAASVCKNVRVRSSKAGIENLTVRSSRPGIRKRALLRIQQISGKNKESQTLGNFSFLFFSKFQLLYPIC